MLLWVILMEVSGVGCFQIIGRWICYSIFFDISFIVFFTRLLSNCLWKNYTFSAQVSKTHFKMYYNTKMATLWIWVKKLKTLYVLGNAFSEIKNAGIFNFSWIKYFCNYFSFQIKWHVRVCYCWNFGPLNLKQTFHCKLYILRKTVQDMVLDRYHSI